MSRLVDRAYVDEQYRDASRLDARVRLYQLYGTRPETWTEWLFEALELRPGERALEVGCGSGNLWRDNAGRVPPSLRPLLSDRSAGMLAAARARLAPARFAFARLDARALPFAAASFDVGLANHMLYHVPDRGAALAELRRVLAPGGRLCVGTNDWTHLLELRELVTRFEVENTSWLPVGRDPGLFDLETAAAELAAASFRVARVRRYRNALEVTGVEALMDYVLTTVPDGEANAGPLARLRRHVEEQIARLGSLHIGASVGLIEAVRD